VSFHLSKYAPSTHRFDFAITLCVIGILATCLLHYLNAAQNEFEKAIQKTELNNLQLGITETWVHNSMSNKSMNIEALKNSNPMLLIATKPNNYIGEHAQAPSGSRAIWYFNTQKKQLIYVFNSGLEAAYILVCRAGQTSASLVSVGG
jgi:general secretion pathway protein G